MIQANELKIGNWILEDGEPSMVYSLERGGISFYKINDIPVNKETGCTINGGQDRFKPIELSPNILQACGFEREDLGNDPPYEWWTHKENERFEVWNFNEEHWILDMADQYGIGQEHFHFLHQLQNLFFALTGSELTINFKKVKV